MAVGNRHIGVVQIAALDGDGDFLTPRIQHKAAHNLRGIGQLAATGNQLLHCAVLQSKIQAVVQNALAKLNACTHRQRTALRSSLAAQAAVGLQRELLLRLFCCTHKAHILLHLLLVLMQIIMVHSRTARYCLIRIQRHNRLQTEEFAQTLDNHIKLAHAAVDDDRVHMQPVAKLRRALLQHVENRVDDVARISDALQTFIRIKLQPVAHQRLEDFFNLLLRKAVVIGVADAAHVAADRKALVLIGVPAKAVLRGILRLVLHRFTQIQLQALGIIEQLRHNRTLQLAQTAYCLRMRCILLQIMLIHHVSNRLVEVIAAQQRIAVGGNLLNLQNLRIILTPLNRMQRDIQRAAAQVKHHDLSFLLQIKNLF